MPDRDALAQAVLDALSEADPEPRRPWRGTRRVKSMMEGTRRGQGSGTVAILRLTLATHWRPSMEPSEVADLLNKAAAFIDAVPFEDRKDQLDDLDVLTLEILARGFDQPGDGPLAYSEAEGRMVRMVPWSYRGGQWRDAESGEAAWLFPAALEAEQ
jgi:hypothetical protein